MAQEQNGLAYGQSFRSSFGGLTNSMSPQALSFTSRSVVGTLDAENPFAMPGASFNTTVSSFRVPPPDQVLPEYQTLPMQAMPSQQSILNTSAGPVGTISSPMGTATGPAGLSSTMTMPAVTAASLMGSMGSMQAPPTATFSPAASVGTPTVGYPPPMGSMIVQTTDQLEAPAVPQSAVIVPSTGPLQQAQVPGTTQSMATFGAIPGVMVVPPTAPTFASMPVISQQAAAPMPMVMKSMPAVPVAAAVQATPVVPAAPAVPAGSAAVVAASAFAIGSEVEYYSEKVGGWVRATVEGYDEVAGEYILDMGPQAPGHKLRPATVFVNGPTPPDSSVMTMATAPQEVVTVATSGFVPASTTLAPSATVMAPPISTVMAPPVSSAQMATVVKTLSPTNVTSSIAANPFSSGAVITGATQSLSSTSPAAVTTVGLGAPVLEPAYTTMPHSSTVVVKQVGTTIGPTVVAASSPAANSVTVSAVATPVSTSVYAPPVAEQEPARVIGTTTSVAAPPMEPVYVPSQAVGATASYVSAPAVGSDYASYAAQGDMYTIPPEDIWLPVGEPAVRVEPNWRDGQWWYTTAVDFKGLERYPVGSKQETLVLADEALLRMEEEGRIPPLPEPKAWSETDTCPIT